MQKLIFGGASLSGKGGGYSFGDISESQAQSLLEKAYDFGFRVFDTAPIYGFGESERRIGKAFEKNREQVHIISKCGVDWHENGRVNMTNDPKIAIKMLEESLRRLNSDYIDFYLVHWPDAKVDIRYTYEALSKAKERGHIKSLGLCNTNLDDFQKAREIDEVKVVQSEFNLFNQKNFDFLKDFQDVWAQGWGTLDKGILSGRLTAKRQKEKDFDDSDCRKSAPWWKTSEVIPRIEKFERFQKVLKEYEVDPVSFSLQLGEHNVVPVDSLIAPKSISQLESSMSSLEIKIDSNVMKELKKEWESLED